VVASRLALYAALVKAGAVVPVGAPGVDQAAALAKRILLAWSDRGFKDAHGRYLSMPSQFCDEHGKTGEATETGVGLAIARGVIYSVHAQDLLMYSGAVTQEEAKRLNTFHAAMYDLIRNALNYNFAGHHAWACDHYSNHAANQLAGLLATARLLDDTTRFDAALFGADPSISVTLPWTAYFDRAVYGDADLPNACYANSGSDGATSKPFFQTGTVAAGEIDIGTEMPIRRRGSAIRCSRWNDCLIQRRSCGSLDLTPMAIAVGMDNRSRRQPATTPASQKRPASQRLLGRKTPPPAPMPRNILARSSTVWIATSSSARIGFQRSTRSPS
jgi:hypothetical protein